ncbi:MAG: TIGR04053 family radical SAM/SPASM domain-containing protein [Acidobacteriaceae bacterium]
MKKIAIIGGGITGLATAFYLQEYTHGSIDITLIESAPRLGGKIASAQESGFVIEGGPDSFLTRKTVMLDLCRKLGLEGQLVGSNSAKRTTYVWSRGHLHPMPEGMMLMAPTMVLPFLRSRLVSWRGKLRMGMEMFIPKRPKDEDESLASFVRRRLGKEALDKIAAPLMAGIFAADPEMLSMQSTFPIFLEMERKHGSLLRGILQQKRAKERIPVRPGPKEASPSMFMTLRGGLQQLVDAIVSRLHPQTVLLNRHVLSVTRDQEQYRIDLSDGPCILADEIVFATPAYVTANLIREIDTVLAMKLRAIRYVSTATVSLGFESGDIEFPLDGFGFVVPHNENRQITACSWSSTKFNHRAPEGYALIRVFVGGARAEALAELDEAALVELAREELRAIMGITATPLLARTYRWHKANPQYDVGHQARIADIDKIVAWHPGLHLAGAAYHGAGIPDCIQGAIKVARSIARKTPHKQEEGCMTEISRRLFVSSNGGIQVVPSPANNSDRSDRSSDPRDFAKNPMLVYWEMTQACALACRHCRAEAVSTPHPSELTRTESEDLLRQIAAFDKPLPHLILTGGDPLKRADVYDLIDYAHTLGLTVSITPSATPDLTFDVLAKLKAHGIESLGLSLDGSSAARHEAVRGVEGCFDWTIRAAKDAAKLEIPIQVNTLVSQETADDLPAIYELLKSLKVMRWSLFFLIAVGRGKMLQPVSPERGEELMHWVYDLSRVAPFAIKTTEAPSYRRVALNRMRGEGMLSGEIQNTPVYRGFGVRDGHGIVFVSNQGDIYPAGFLPLAVGNVRLDNLVDVYRDSPMFRALHAPSLFKGKCGQCEYRALCGGSRARAFAYTGDALASDPFCPYEPKASAVSSAMVS